ncbi:hypothetical protein ACQEWB_16445 [Streptomyces sp. CA-249302]|uniref:hypothetical protein n=1 Tax=Streptomyces sp. CA-249302 TaxID=3240058 RepID=UPI003D9132A6
MDPELPTRVIYHVYRSESHEGGDGPISAALRTMTGRTADHRLISVPVGTDHATVRQELSQADFAGHHFDAAHHTLRVDWSSEEQPPPASSVEETRLLLYGCALALCPGPAARAATWLFPGSGLFWLVLVLMCTTPFVFRSRFTTRMGRTLCTGERHTPLEFKIVGVILTAGLTVVGVGSALVLAPIAWLLVTVSAVFGVWLAVRDTVLTRHAAWIVPLAVPALWPVAAWLGGQAHEAYLRQFGIPAEEVPVSALSTYGAALPILWKVAVDLLVVLGLLGWARHLHLVYRATRAAILSIICVASALAVTYTVLTGLDDAGSAAVDAQQAVALHSRTPAEFHGLQGTLVCVLLVDPGKEIPVDNGPVPTTPVLSFGSSADWIHLWDPNGYRGFAVRREDVRILAPKLTLGAATTPATPPSCPQDP